VKDTIYFDEAFNHVMRNEGGYANHALDKGGETYCGISRKYHPEWEGWGFIDVIKEREGGIANNRSFFELNPDVKAFYKHYYWDKIRGDEITDHELTIAVFDAAVNCGVVPASQMLQKTLNILNCNEHYWDNIKVDGIIGKKTLQTLNIAGIEGKSTLVYNTYNLYRGKYYIEIMENNEDQERWAFAWFSRLHFMM
jgi:Putative secretion activating protein